MRKSICYKTAGSVIVLALAIGSAKAQINDLSSPIILPSSSSSYNQNGFNLPNQPNISGQDLIRGPSGITCQSAIGSNGPKLDMGMIGSNDIFNRETLSFYGRVSVPLGKKPKRVDCTKLYDLEISRLKMELQLMRAGAMPGMLDQRAARNVVTQLPPVETEAAETTPARTPLVIKPKKKAKKQETAQLITNPEAPISTAPKAAVTTYAELTPAENPAAKVNLDIVENTQPQRRVVKDIKPETKPLKTVNLKVAEPQIIPAAQPKPRTAAVVKIDTYVKTETPLTQPVNVAETKNATFQDVTFDTADIVPMKVELHASVDPEFAEETYLNDIQEYKPSHKKAVTAHKVVKAEKDKILPIETVIPRIADRTHLITKVVEATPVKDKVSPIESVIPKIADRTWLETKMVELKPMNIMAKVEPAKDYEMVYRCRSTNDKGSGVQKKHCEKVFRKLT